MRVDWWNQARLYEVYVDKFAGNFKGLIDRLPYLEFLGINAVHILPFFLSPRVDDGYDVADYKSIQPELGTLSDFSHFTTAARERGIRVFVDLVLNHVSISHPWFLSAKYVPSSKYRDYFVWSETGTEFKDAANPFPDFKKSNWIGSFDSKEFYYATYYPEQADLNWENPRVLEEVLSVVDFWVSLGVEGFRLDAAPYLIAQEGTSSEGLGPTHAILKSVRQHVVREHGDRVALLAEVGGTSEQALQYFGSGDECHMVYHFELMREMWLSLMTGKRDRVETLARSSFATLPERCQWATFLRNHDEISLDTVEESEREALVDFLDPSHSYLFRNKTTTAVRIGNVFQNNPAAQYKALELLYSLPGAPVMYYGDEIGMTNLPVRRGEIDSRRYVRGSFDWAAAEAMQKDPRSLLSQVSKLIHNRAV